MQIVSVQPQNKEKTNPVNITPNKRGAVRQPAGAHRYLSFTVKDAFERCLVSVSLLGMVSVPALNSDRRMIHLLNKPADTQEKCLWFFGQTSVLPLLSGRPD